MKLVNFYKVLGIPENATNDDIKKAFRTLALKHHPDRGGDAELFKIINNAYEFLMDPNKRVLLDRALHPLIQQPQSVYVFQYGFSYTNNATTLTTSNVSWSTTI